MGFRMIGAQLLLLITSWTVVKCLVSIPDSPSRQLVRYQYRVKLIHNLLIDEGCIKESPVRLEREIIYSDDVPVYLEIEKELYQHLFQMLFECRNLKQSKDPNSPRNKLSETTSAQNCSSKYKLNPVSSTCIRLVQQSLSWENAKAACEADGEKLAVFPSLKSVLWLDSVLRDPINAADWGKNFHWIGLRYLDDVWRWQGRNTSSISTSDPVWDREQNEPSKSDGTACGCVTGDYGDWKKIHYCVCRAALNFICEKI